MWDIVSQVWLAVFGPLSIILVSKKNKWGFVVGLSTQPFWFITTIAHRQWGIVILTVVYTITWLFGIYEWFFKKPSNSNISSGP